MKTKQAVKKCGLPSIMLCVSLLPAEDRETQLGAASVCHGALRGRL